MRMRFLIVSSLLLITGCNLYQAPSKIKRSFEYEFKKGDEYISQIYYYQYKDNEFDSYSIFFKDGTCCRLNATYFGYYGVSNIQELLRIACQGKKKEFYKFGDWGYYEVENDTIYLKEIFYHSYGSSYWNASNSKFLFQNGDTLRMFSQDYFYPLAERIDCNITLIPLDTCYCLESDSWLKYEEWFWKNEQDYLNWIEKSGGDRKKYKF